MTKLPLNFQALQAANRGRMEDVPLFAKCKNWTAAQWFQALVGEIGEYANFAKKLDRGDLTPAQFRVEAAKELADAQHYLSMLADHLGIDLGEATRDKFNEVSIRVGSDWRL